MTYFRYLSPLILFLLSCRGCSNNSDAGNSFDDSFPVDDTDSLPHTGDTGDTYMDADSDGYPVTEDCNDNDYYVNPGVAETCNNLQDDNCDGTPNSCLLTSMSLADAYAKLLGREADQYAGYSVASVGDMDNDGLSDTAVGIPGYDGNAGAVAIFYGPIPEGKIDFSLVDAIIYGDPESWFGYAVSSAGDVNKDGFDDLLVGAPGDSEAGSYAGAASIFLGPLMGEISLDEAEAKWTGEEEGDLAGSAVSSAGFFDGDDYPDLLIGARAYQDDPTTGLAQGAAYLVSGIGALTFDSLSNARLRFYGDTYYDYLGGALAGGADINEDGFDDIVLGASNTYVDELTDCGYEADTSLLLCSGAAYVFFGRGGWSGAVFPVLADAILRGVNKGDRAGMGVALGYLNDDDSADVVVGAPFADPGGDRSGTSYVLYGSSVEGEHSLADADALVEGNADGQCVGISQAILGKMETDSARSLLIGASGCAVTGTSEASRGIASLFWEELSGSYSIDEANVTLTGEELEDAAGYCVASGRDMDGDGYDEALVGAIQNSEGGYNAGAVYVVPGMGI